MSLKTCEIWASEENVALGSLDIRAHLPEPTAPDAWRNLLSTPAHGRVALPPSPRQTRTLARLSFSEKAVSGRTTPLPCVNAGTESTHSPTAIREAMTCQDLLLHRRLQKGVFYPSGLLYLVAGMRP